MARDITKIIVHCSATKPDQDIGAAEIKRWHVEENGWSDIGYHFVIRRSGRIEQGRHIDTHGAHCKGHNTDSIGVCLVGGLGWNGDPEPDFTAEQFDALVHLVKMLEYVAPNATLHGHRDFNPDKACPSFDVVDFMRGIELKYDV